MHLNHIIQKELISSQLETLSIAFQQLASQSQIKVAQRDALFNDLKQKYQQGLSYHNLSHILSFISIANQFQKEILNPIPFYWAIWYHDAIYNPKKKDNEEQSAALAMQALQLFLPKEDLEQIKSLIRSTATHLPLNKEDSDHSLFLDMDLSILAAPRTIYQHYAQSIAEEYNHVPRLFYKFGRKKIMKRFLARPTIYYSAGFQKWGEEKARANIKNEIKGFWF